jgi:hypothetical protein
MRYIDGFAIPRPVGKKENQMNSTTINSPISTKKLWAGRKLGYSASVTLSRGLGVLTLAIAVLYAMPRTALVVAILLTGLLGGAMAYETRNCDQSFSHITGRCVCQVSASSRC